MTCFLVTGCNDDDDDDDDASVGSIYTFGGYSNSRSAWWSDVWRYRISTDAWTTLTAAHALAKYASIIKDGIIYTFGGETQENTWTDEIWAYNLVTGETTYLNNDDAATPSARIEHTAVLYSDKIYIFGGYDSGYDQNIYIYDIATNTWSKITSSGTWPAGRRAHSAVVYGDKMYVFGGRQGDTLYEDLWAFDFATQTWTQKDSYTSYGRYGHRAVVYGDVMYVFGGVNSEDTYVSSLLMYAFTASSSFWSNDNLAVQGRAFCAMTLDASGNIYIFGGYSGTSYLQDLIKYDIANDTLYTKTTPPDDRAYFQAFYYTE